MEILDAAVVEVVPENTKIDQMPVHPHRAAVPLGCRRRRRMPTLAVEAAEDHLRLAVAVVAAAVGRDHAVAVVAVVVAAAAERLRRAAVAAAALAATRVTRLEATRVASLDRSTKSVGVVAQPPFPLC